MSQSKDCGAPPHKLVWELILGGDQRHHDYQAAATGKKAAMLLKSLSF